MMLLQYDSDNLPYEKVGKNEPVCIADEVPFEIPDSWEWVRIKNLGAIIRGSGIKRNETVESGFPCVRYGEIYTTYNTSFTSTVSFIPEEINEKCKHFSYGDILMTLTGENKPDIAKAVACLGEKPVAAGGDLAFWTAHGMNPLYLAYLLASPYVISRKVELATGDIIVHISGDKIGSILIPIPPLNEQMRIVEKIQETECQIRQYSEKEQELTTLHKAFPETLKKSILLQAVQGKLVEQDPTDEPTEILLERIRAKKQRLVKEGKVKKNKHESIIFRRDNSHYEKLDGIERCIDDEIPFKIPDSWEWVRMGSLFTVNPRNAVPDDTTVGFMSMPLLQDGFNNSHTFEEKPWKDVKSGFTHFADNDVVVAKITPCFQNRKSAVIRNLPNGYGAGTTELHVLRDCTKILYMPYFLLLCKTHAFIQDGMKNFSGTAGQQRVGKDFISNYLVPLPPVEEQKRIVQKANFVIESCNIL